MKKTCTRAILLVFVLAIVSSCSGREAKENFYTNAGELLVNSANKGTFTFGLTLFTKFRVNKVECIGLDGSGINFQNCDIEIADNNVDQLSTYRHKGLYVQTLLITITPLAPCETCNITRIHLSVDGEKQKIDFPHPLNHDFTYGNEFNEGLRLSMIPNEFPSRFINDKDQHLIYMFTATEDIVLEEVQCTDFLQLADLEIRENGTSKGNGVFPVSLTKGSDVEISFRYISDLADECSYVATTLIFKYRRSLDNEELANKVQLIFDPIYPVSGDDTSQIDQIIERLIDE